MPQSTVVLRAHNGFVVTIMAILAMMTTICLWTPTSSSQQASNETLIVQIGPLRSAYMYFSPSEAQALLDDILSAISAYDTQNPLCNAATTNPAMCIGIGSGVVDSPKVCVNLVIYEFCQTYITIAEELLELPTLANEELDDFVELGLYGIPDATAAITTGLITPNPVSLAFQTGELVLAATSTSSADILTETGCFGIDALQPQYVIDPGNYLTVAVTGLRIPAGVSINLSGLAMAPYSWSASSALVATGTATNCASGQQLPQFTLNTPQPVMGCQNDTEVPLVVASIVNASGNETSIPVTVPTPSAPTTCTPVTPFSSSAAPSATQPTVPPVKSLNSSTTTTSPSETCETPPSGGGSPPTAAPKIGSVSAISDSQDQTIVISGSGFGYQCPFDGNTPYLQLADITAGLAVPVGQPPNARWNAGNSGTLPSGNCAASSNGDWVTVNVTSWTDSQIVIKGFTGSYGGYDGLFADWQFYPGDQVQIEVWNAQSSAGPACQTVTAEG